MKSKIWPVFLRLCIAALVVGLGFYAYFFLLSSKPEAGFRAPPRRDPLIEVIRPELQNYTVILQSQGEVQARTQSNLVPEVPGRVIQVASTFTEGGYVDEGEVLLRLDPRDYEVALATAEAEVAQMEVALAEEEALARQAAGEWQRLNPTVEATSLVLREPQLKRAQANLEAAKARATRAALNLERTEIRAPYDGRVLTQNVDVGQFVGSNTLVATIYAVDSAEVRLPLSSRQLRHVELPELRRDGVLTGNKLPVTLSSELSGNRETWQGYIVRSEGSIDSSSRQLFVIAEVEDPYGPTHAQPMKVGMFVEAEIEGTTLENVWVLPAESLREGSFVLQVLADNTLLRQDVDVLWSDRTHIVVPASAFAEPPKICITPLNFAVNGMRVAIKGEGGPPGRPGGRAPTAAAPDEAPAEAAKQPSEKASS